MKKNKAIRNHAPCGAARYSQPRANRHHKDRLFRLLFAEKSSLLQLYNAMRGSNYENPDDLIITTNDDVIYMGMKNDISFLIDNVLNLYEHQASFNPNMGLRGFLYLADSYRKFIDSNGLYLYGSKALRLPVPQYIVFYNGTAKEPDRMEIRLSDLFEKADGILPCVETTAVMLNINKGHNRELMQKCRILSEYSEFIGRIRENQAVCDTLEDAVNKAVASCIRDNILAEFLKAHRAEVIEVVLTEYDEKGYIAYEKKLSREEGRQEGIAAGEFRKLIQQVCKKLSKGKSADQIAAELEEEPHTIRQICDAAALFAPDYDCDKIGDWLQDHKSPE